MTVHGRELRPCQDRARAPPRAQTKINHPARPGPKITQGTQRPHIPPAPVSPVAGPGRKPADAFRANVAGDVALVPVSPSCLAGHRRLSDRRALHRPSHRDAGDRRGNRRLDCRRPPLGRNVRPAPQRGRPHPKVAVSALSRPAHGSLYRRHRTHHRGCRPPHVRSVRGGQQRRYYLFPRVGRGRQFAVQCQRPARSWDALRLRRGRYYEPRIEERALLFIDMRSSTAIAEQLGEPAS